MALLRRLSGVEHPHRRGRTAYSTTICTTRGSFFDRSVIPPQVSLVLLRYFQKIFIGRRPFLPSCDDLGKPQGGWVVPLREQASVVSFLFVIIEIRGYSVLSIYGLLIEIRYISVPLVRLIPSSHCFRFDLKSATDRWSLLYLFEIVADRSFASSVLTLAPFLSLV